MKFFYYLFISYFLLQIANLYRIINDPQLKIYAKRQYSKKVKKVLRRKPIYDKHGLLLSYSLVKEEREKREYMVKELLSILGIVGFEEHGMSGIELAYDRYLSTKEQICFLSRLTAKDKIHGYIANPTTAGLKTTLDAQLSLYINTFLKEVVQKYRSKFGVCIVMDGTTGAIEVMTQFPFYSPEKEECDVPLEYLYPLGVTQAYEMGSIIKSFLALAAIHTNVVHADDIINCYGVKEKKFKGRTITTWKAHDKITFKEVIQGSNNIGVAQVGQLIGTKLFDVYQMCGFGKSTGIELIGEHKGILYDPSKWSKQSLISLTFGYEMAITLLQGVVAWSLFTNEGRLLVPRLLLSEDRKMSDILFTSKVIDRKSVV